MIGLSHESYIIRAFMETVMASTGDQVTSWNQNQEPKEQFLKSIFRLCNWLEENDYRGYDTFDGLSARFLRPLTFETRLLRTVLLQGVRRFPLNTRPLLG